ncbi:MAG TPA: MlaD family protein [Verrucomicrobiota bacterium]|nr:MlaD family protein [Verrucomicrobiota bacterium]
MALQDLTPQLRTRLSRMERAAGWFVLLAVVLLMAGLAYYLKVMAERKGWGVQKIRYQTSLSTAAGLKVGNPVKLMGFDVGEITRIEANDPTDYDYGVTVYFWIKKPYFGYLWSDSQVKVASELLGGRYLEVTKGYMGVPTVYMGTNEVALGVLRQGYFNQQLQEQLQITNSLPEALKTLNRIAYRERETFYARPSPDASYWLEPLESPAINDRLEKLANQVEAALPNILDYTNRIAAILDTNRIATIISNVALITTETHAITADVREKLVALGPTLTNISLITGNLSDPDGSLGEWLLSTNLYVILDDVDRSLVNLAAITSNLNFQVQENPAMLGQISSAVTNADNLVQGLQRHWLLRSAFKPAKTNAPAKKR